MEEKLKGANDKSSGAAAGDRHTPWLPSAERDKKDPGLAAVLRKVLAVLGLLLLNIFHMFCLGLCQTPDGVAAHRHLLASFLAAHSRGQALSPTACKQVPA